MQAVVRSGGKQYRVEEGATITVDRLAGEPGATVSLDDVLFYADGDNAGAGTGTKVTGEIVGHDKGDKIKVLKYKNKVRYRKLSGQRALTTRIKVTKIERGK
ncbi:MAG: 50S ribosomal protein L21 [Chloroflexi bacterium]|nr:50S ribosomal protein L21 [Chloroflexota bacterium]